MRSALRPLAAFVALGLLATPAAATDRVAVGELKPKTPIVAPLALFAKGTKVGSEPVPVAVGSVYKAPTVGITVAQVREASALWGLVLLDAPVAAKGDLVANAALKTVPLKLGAWLEKPAGLDAVAIAEPADVPIGSTVVDDKRRFVGIVARVPGQPGPVLIRERTLRMFASASVATSVAPAMPPTPLALVVDDGKVSGKLAQRDDELKKSGPRLAAGAAEFSAMPPEVRAEAATSLLQGGFVFGDDDADKTLAVVLPSSGVQLAQALEKVERATRGVRGLKLVVHVLPADQGTQAHARVSGAYCSLQGSSTPSFASLRKALEGATPAPCVGAEASSFLNAEMLLLTRLDIDEPLAAAGSTVVALTEPASVLRAVLETTGNAAK
jgi:hypothetical protein